MARPARTVCWSPRQVENNSSEGVLRLRHTKYSELKANSENCWAHHVYCYLFGPPVFKPHLRQSVLTVKQRAPNQFGRLDKTDVVKSDLACAFQKQQRTQILDRVVIERLRHTKLANERHCITGALVNQWLYLA